MIMFVIFDQSGFW